MRSRKSFAKIVRSSLWLGLIIYAFLPARSYGQWKVLLQPNDSAAWIYSNSVYFLDLPGPPRIGFASGGDTTNLRISGGRGVIFKTTNGGYTWRKIPLASVEPASDFVFKDSMTGWFAGGDAGEGVYKTTDGGDSWFFLPGSLSSAVGIYYDKQTDGLFVSTWGSYYTPKCLLVSWDEGLTWLPVTNSNFVYNGFAFNNDRDGILSMGYEFGTPWLRTSDAGKTWEQLQIDSECWQPVAIPGTKTQFAITDVWGNILRTNDMWDNWLVIYSFPFQPGARGFTNGTIRGDSAHLFVQLNDGVYMSTDQGNSWKYLCGQPYDLVPDTSYLVDYMYDHRFFVHYPYVYIITHVGPDRNATLWELNLDSMQYFTPTGGLMFPDSSKRTTVQPGTPVTINYSPQTSDPIGIDTGHLVFHYDSNSLSLKSLKLPPSWIILDSSTSGGVLDLRIIDTTGSQLPTPAVQLTFNTYLTSPTAKIYLDSADLSGHRLNCDCQALSIIGPDSVEIDFTGCGDSLLLAAMEHTPPFSIERIIPNPAGESFEINVNNPSSVPIAYTLFDALGNEVFTATGAGRAQQVPTDGLPSGIYFLRLSENGYVQTRQIAIEH